MYIWIEVIPEHGKNFLVASGYRHSTDSDFFDKFSPIMDKANETNLEIFVLGDLNCDRLTLIYPAHFEDVPCQSRVNHIFEG